MVNICSLMVSWRCVCVCYRTGTREMLKAIVSTWFLIRTSSLQMLLGRKVLHLPFGMSKTASRRWYRFLSLTRLHIPNLSSISTRFLLSTQKPPTNHTFLGIKRGKLESEQEKQPASWSGIFSQEHVPAWQPGEVPGGHAASEADCIHWSLSPPQQCFSLPVGSLAASSIRAAKEDKVPRKLFQIPFLPRIEWFLNESLNWTK